MNANSPKNLELMANHRFVSSILNRPLEPYGNGTPPNDTIDTLEIKFEKADGDLMFRRACNTGLDEASCFFGAKGKDKKVPERSYSYVFKFTQVMERRLSQGGVRLAAYLNALFAQPLSAK